MFGHNRVVGQKFFREAPEAQAGKLLVTSVFRTLQGEGPHAGTPAIFVRLAYCQLKCSFCDTFFDHGDWLSYDELLDRIAGIRSNGMAQDLLVVTGGEPTLQANLGDFLDYAMLCGAFARTQIETNGLIAPEVPNATCVVMSPKCAEKNGKPTHYLEPPHKSLERANCLKFVLSGDPQSVYHSVPEWALLWHAETGRDVFVSPMAEYQTFPAETKVIYQSRRAPSMGDRERAEKVSFWEPGLLDLHKCRRNYEWAAAYAVEHGVRLSIQQHLFASLP